MPSQLWREAFLQRICQVEWIHGRYRFGKGTYTFVSAGYGAFLIAALFASHTDLKEQKLFRIFLKVYNIGVPLTAVMLAVRGITQVLGLTLSTGADAAISGIAGIGHIFTGAGLILFILSLKRLAKN